MIKFSLRGNLIYPFQLIIWHFLRTVETKIIGYLFNFSDSLVYTPLMFISEFTAGLIIYLYQKNFLKKEEGSVKFFSIELIQNKQEGLVRRIDSDKIIFLLIFFSSFFDWIQFLLWTVSVPRFKKVSNSLLSRLNGFKPIFCAINYYYVLKLPLFKHHFFSLKIIFICSIIVLISEFFFQEVNIFLTYWDFILVLAFIFLSHVLSCLVDLVEKYLFEYDCLNPFITLMFEGMFGFFLSLLYFFFPGFLDDIKLVYSTNSTGNIILFSFLLFLYIILCGGRDLFRVVTTKIYSPMARNLTDYFLNPIYLIYDFSLGKDFLTNEKRNISYFILNLIISIILSICGCVYNEFLILFFCGLETDTHDQIAKRALSYESVGDELESFNGDGDGDNRENSIINNL